MKIENISVIGLGYIGLPTAAMFASHGVNTIGVDVSEHVVKTINDGRIHIIEPNLADMVENTVMAGRLKASLKVQPADAYILAVPTPFKQSKAGILEPDLSYVKAACTSIAPVLRAGNLVVLESTSPVGTTEKVRDWLSELRPDLKLPDAARTDADVFVAYCPERVLPGNVVEELIQNDRIIGGITAQCSLMAASLYQIFLKGECYQTNSRTAEMVKLTENASRDAQLAFANEISMICDELAINASELIELANKHPRVNILQPGAGVGGHCIAVDPYFIINSAPETAKMISVARQVNNNKTDWVIEKVSELIKQTCPEHIIICGITFKADIDDIRQSPSLKIAQSLNILHPTKVTVWEPNYNSEMEIEGLCIKTNVSTKIDNALYIILVGHSTFIDMPNLPKNLVDFAGIFKYQGLKK